MSDFSAMPSLNQGNTQAKDGQTHRLYVFVRNLRIDALIGVYDWEQAAPQPLAIDLEYGLPTPIASFTDCLADTIDYAAVINRLKELALARHYDLVEALGEAMALLLQAEFRIPWLRLRLTKLAPFPGAEVGIVIERGRLAP